MSAPALTWEQQEILDLRDRVDDLEQENEHLRSLLSGAGAGALDRLSIELALTKAEAAVLWSLVSSPSGYRTKEALQYAARRRGGDVDVASNLVSVLICSLRKKIATKGLVIATVWGAGYRIDQQSRSKVQSMIKKASRND